MNGPARHGFDLAALARRHVDRTLIRFLVVGVVTTLIDFVLFGGLTSIAGLAVIPANVISYSTGMVASFLLNRSWAFGLKGGRIQESGAQALRYVASNAVSLVLSTAIVASFALFMPKQWAKLLSIPIVFLWNYSVARLWVFRRSAPSAADEDK